MTDQPKTLDEWRLSWTAEELAWRTGWAVEQDERRIERERASRERRKQDRRTFGKTLWGMSGTVRKAEVRASRLQSLGLPALSSEADLAAWLGISLTRLRWYTHDKPVESVWHYVRYDIPKRRGGKRLILAPKTELKAIQRKILADLLSKIPVHTAAHGFVAGHSVVSNAGLHVGKAFVLNLDLKDFFPGIGFRRVRALFVYSGYGLSVASALALLCTERERYPLVRNGRTVWVSIGERCLIQGAPTSPAISNLIARPLDARLQGMAARLGLTYSRYADDLTFSGDDQRAIIAAQGFAKKIVAAEGFVIHSEKTHLYRQSNRQIVTGLVVNDKVSVPRAMRRRMRAILHNAQKTGLAAQNQHDIPDFRAYLLGLIGYINETDPNLAVMFNAILKNIRD